MKKIVFLFLTILMLLMIGCSNIYNNEQQVSKSGIYFDTFVTVTVYGTDNEKIVNDCMQLCEHYENLFSKTIESSDVSRINKAAGQPVKVDSDTIELIEKAIYYSELSDGLFDITIAPVSDMWDFHSEDEAVIPNDKEIREALKHISYRVIEIDKANSTVKLLDKDSKIDLGGIAKGYIADKLRDKIKSLGYTSALINLGGNIEAVGKKPDGSSFRIGIKKPFHDNELLDEVFIDDKSVSSSGVYERYFYKEDKLYHHILNPKTGYPVETDLFGVSIICDSSVDADALGTICILMGYEKGSKLIESLNGVKAIWAFAE